MTIQTINQTLIPRQITCQRKNIENGNSNVRPRKKRKINNRSQTGIPSIQTIQHKTATATAASQIKHTQQTNNNNNNNNPNHNKEQSSLGKHVSSENNQCCSIAKVSGIQI